MFACIVANSAHSGQTSKDEKAYAFTEEMVRERVEEARQQGATEIHVVGGLHHQKKFDWYLDLIRFIREADANIHIKGWTAVEINWFSHITKKPFDWILQQLLDVGLGSMPGGGAEIFDESVRRQLCEHKADSEKWIEIHRTAPSARHPHQRDHALRACRRSNTSHRPFEPLAIIAR